MLPGGRKRPVLSLLKLRQAALNDAVDEANDLLAAVFFIALHNHVHQPVGQMGVEHFQLRLRYAMQVLFPVGDAFAPGKPGHLCAANQAVSCAFRQILFSILPAFFSIV